METRQIKFKAKDIRGKWVEGDLCHNLTGGLSILGYKEENGMSCFSGCHTIDPSTVCQFTGLKDKDGKPIWEHDLVDSFPISEVVYIHGAFMLYQKDEDRKAYHPLLYFVQGDVLLDCKVIQSKFDRKEGEK